MIHVYSDMSPPPRNVTKHWLAHLSYLELNRDGYLRHVIVPAWLSMACPNELIEVQLTLLQTHPCDMSLEQPQ